MCVSYSAAEVQRTMTKTKHTDEVVTSQLSGLVLQQLVQHHARLTSFIQPLKVVQMLLKDTTDNEPKDLTRERKNSSSS